MPPNFQLVATRGLSFLFQEESVKFLAAYVTLLWSLVVFRCYVTTLKFLPLLRGRNCGLGLKCLKNPGALAVYLCKLSRN